MFSKFDYDISLNLSSGKADEWTEEELVQTAEAVGYGAVK